MRYAEIRPVGTAFEVYVHAIEDGHDTIVDLYELPPFDQDTDEEDFGRLLASTDGPQDALDLAEEYTGASRGRWVNQGIAQDEYLDFVRAGRPSDRSPGGHAWPGSRTEP